MLSATRKMSRTIRASLSIAVLLSGGVLVSACRAEAERLDEVFNDYLKQNRNCFSLGNAVRLPKDKKLLAGQVVHYETVVPDYDATAFRNSLKGMEQKGLVRVHDIYGRKVGDYLVPPTQFSVSLSIPQSFAAFLEPDGRTICVSYRVKETLSVGETFKREGETYRRARFRLEKPPAEFPTNIGSALFMFLQDSLVPGGPDAAEVLFRYDGGRPIVVDAKPIAAGIQTERGKTVEKEADRPPERRVLPSYTQAEVAVLDQRVAALERQEGVKFPLLSLDRYCQKAAASGLCRGSQDRLHPKADRLLNFEGKDGRVSVAVYPTPKGELEWMLVSKPGWQHLQGDNLRLLVWDGRNYAEPFKQLTSDVYVAADLEMRPGWYRHLSVAIDVINPDPANRQRTWNYIRFGDAMFIHRKALFRCLLAPLSETAPSVCRADPLKEDEVDKSDPVRSYQNIVANRMALRHAKLQSRVLEWGAPRPAVDECLKQVLDHDLDDSAFPEWLRDRRQGIAGFVTHLAKSRCETLASGRQW